MWIFEGQQFNSIHLVPNEGINSELIHKSYMHSIAVCYQTLDGRRLCLKSWWYHLGIIVMSETRLLVYAELLVQWRLRTGECHSFNAVGIIHITC